MNTEWSALLLWKPSDLRHNQTSYLEPSPRRLLETIYRLFSPENFPFLPLSSKTWWRSPWRKALLTSSWCSGQDLLAATDRMTRMELSLVWPQEQTSRDNRCYRFVWNLSPQYEPSRWSHQLCVSGTHLQPTVRLPLGNVISSQVSFFFRASISSIIAFFPDWGLLQN